MDKLFVIGDVHGERLKLERLLQEWKPDSEQLVLLGDLVDRGPDSYGVVKLARALHETYGAVIIGGNHDQMLLDWLAAPEYRYYYSQGGRETIDSFFKESLTFTYYPHHVAKRFLDTFPEEIAFLKELPDYFEWGDFACVHAGVDLTYLDWRETSSVDFKWIREDFHYGTNLSNTTFVFGHTPTKSLNANQSDDVWVSTCGTKIGIDGGAVFGGLLHGLKLHADGQNQVLSLTSDHEMVRKELVVQR